MSPTSYQAAPPRINRMEPTSRCARVSSERAATVRVVGTGSPRVHDGAAPRGSGPAVACGACGCVGGGRPIFCAVLDRGTVMYMRQPCIPTEAFLTRNRLALASLATLLA